MIKAGDYISAYAAVRLAAANGHLETLKYLERQFDFWKSISWFAPARFYSDAAHNGRLEVLNYLERKGF